MSFTLVNTNLQRYSGNFNDLHSGQYHFRIADISGCIKDTTIAVTETMPIGGCNNVFIPNAFTPNNDGLNDIFKPLVDGHLLQYKFMIYDRNGQVVFQSNEPGKGWTGMKNGEPYNTGVFIWMCTYQLAGEQVKVEKGTVALIR